MISHLLLLVSLCSLNVYGTSFPTEQQIYRELGELVLLDSVSEELRNAAKQTIQRITSRNKKRIPNSFEKQESLPTPYTENNEDKEISFALATVLLTRKLIEDSNREKISDGSKFTESKLLPNHGRNISTNIPGDPYTANQQVFRLASSIYFCRAPSLIGYIKRCRNLSTKKNEAEGLNKKEISLTIGKDITATCEANPCGTCAQLTPTSGRITSPNYPGQYPNNLNCTYIITAPVGQKIQFTFTNFSVERDYDYLLVYDIGSPPLNLTHTGYKIPSKITSKSNQLTLVFASDVDNVAFPDGVTGFWEGTYIISNLVPPTTTSTTSTTTETISTSTSTITSESTTTRPSASGGSSDILCSTSSDCGTCDYDLFAGDVIKSQNYPDEYGPNLNCSYTIQVPQGKMISLVFLELLTEECCDYISVYDGDSSPIKLHIGGNVIPDTIYSSTNKISVIFTSDSRNSLLDRPLPSSVAKWMASILAIDPTETTISSSTSEISTQESSTPTQPPTYSETTEISTEVPTTEASIGGVFCSSPQPCGMCDIVSSSGGTIKSPNYSGEYGPNLNCSCIIQVPQGKTISLLFTELLTEECCDYISVYDGISTPLKLHIGGSVIPDQIYSSTNKMTIVFTSDRSNSLLDRPSPSSVARWMANFYVIESTTTTTILTPDETSMTSTIGPTDSSTIQSTTSEELTTTTLQPDSGVTCTSNPCGVDLCSNFTSQGGIISSPDFPSDYGNNRNCDITISSPSRSSISVNFTTFVVEREYDFISVLDKNRIPIKRKISGYIKPSFTVKANKIIFNFKSDEDNTVIPDGQVASWNAKITIIPPKTFAFR